MTIVKLLTKHANYLVILAQRIWVPFSAFFNWLCGALGISAKELDFFEIVTEMSNFDSVDVFR